MCPELLALTHQRWTFALYICMYIVFSFRACFVKGQPSFTYEPPSKLYVLTGRTATFDWKYRVGDRKSDFTSFSPKWSFYDENGREHVIGNEYRFDDWKWKVVNSSCPPRLLNPTLRVIRGENATLNITDVTRADNGVYGCTLVLSSPPSIISKVELIVTVNPQITITGNSNVAENDLLRLTCVAIGPPTPNITWIKAENGKDVVKSQGIGLANLIIRNITKDQDGIIYKCNATNNPNEEQIQKSRTVRVKYSPVLRKDLLSPINLEACTKKEVKLICAAKSFPNSTYYWYNPSNVSEGKNKTGIESVFTIDQVEENKAGRWTCYITNGVGQGIYYHIQLKVLKSDHPNCKKDGKKGLSTAEKVGIGFGVFVLAVVVAVAGVVYYKKKKGRGAKSKGIDVDKQ